MTAARYHHGDLKNALVQAGIDLLSSEGLAALSLRRLASAAGVSHSAPYAHFADKQALIAAISAEGFRRLYDRLEAAAAGTAVPADKLYAVASCYVQFAFESPALYKLMFTGALERETEYTEFVDQSKKNFHFLVDLVQQCQQAGVLRPGPEEVLAVSTWSLVHGFVSLLMEHQVSHQVLDRYPLPSLLSGLLNQITLTDLPSAESQTG